MEDSRITTPNDLRRAETRREINLNSLHLVTDIMGRYIDGTLPLRLRCECGRLGCDVVINVTLEQRQENRRTFPQDFTVIREHLDGDSGDKVLLNAANFVVVQKN